MNRLASAILLCPLLCAGAAAASAQNAPPQKIMVYEGKTPGGGTITVRPDGCRDVEPVAGAPGSNVETVAYTKDVVIEGMALHPGDVSIVTNDAQGVIVRADGTILPPNPPSAEMIRATAAKFLQTCADLQRHYVKPAQ